MIGIQGGIPPCIPDNHLYRVTSTRRRIGTVCSPDDGHIVVRNMWRKSINILRKFVHQVGSICKVPIGLSFLSQAKVDFAPLVQLLMLVTR